MRDWAADLLEAVDDATELAAISPLPARSESPQSRPVDRQADRSRGRLASAHRKCLHISAIQPHW